MPVYCVDCGIKAKKTQSDFSMMNGKIVIKDLPAYRCPKCSKIIFNIDAVAKVKEEFRKALYESDASVDFERTLSSDGKNLTMRIPKQIEKSLNLKRGDRLLIKLESKKRIALKIAT
jgi:hypothetical protein